MRILITGAAGMVGDAVYDEFSAPAEHNVILATSSRPSEPWIEPLDVRDADGVARRVVDFGPDAVIHLAALTDLEYCERNPEKAYDVNYLGTMNVVRAVAGYSPRQVPLVFISTAGIFDGQRFAYREGDLPHPLNVYSQSKLAGELAAASYPGTVIVRAGWMVGGGPGKDKNFIAKLVRLIKGGARELNVVADKFGSPTYTYELARLIRHLLETHRAGTFHGACLGGCSRADMARAMLEGLGLEGKVQVHEVSSSFFRESYFVERPVSERMVNTRLQHQAPHWRGCVLDYMRRFEWL